jgi:hypothetical protein
LEVRSWTDTEGYPHPGCFGKRGCKLLKTKGRGWKKRTKRLQEIGGKGDRGSWEVKEFRRGVLVG